ncbi:MAG: hypothetical protein HUJ61_00210 [Bacilli bacterium]|nr:hypothetical protein [Bacilli bacterium]
MNNIKIIADAFNVKELKASLENENNFYTKEYMHSHISSIEYFSPKYYLIQFENKNTWYIGGSPYFGVKLEDGRIFIFENADNVKGIKNCVEKLQKLVENNFDEYTANDKMLFDFMDEEFPII